MLVAKSVLHVGLELAQPLDHVIGRERLIGITLSTSFPFGGLGHGCALRGHAGFPEIVLRPENSGLLYLASRGNNQRPVGEQRRRQANTVRVGGIVMPSS